jgi:UDP-glucose:glycoprotein glucosyltransferase
VDNSAEKLPLMRYYDFVLDTKPVFESGDLVPARSLFSHLPAKTLLTLGLEVPGPWLIRPKKSLYDLDNIKLSKVPAGRNLEAEFSLEHLLVEGYLTGKSHI